MVEKSSSNAATLFDDLSNIDKQFNALYLEENPDNGTEGLAGEMEMDSREDGSSGHQTFPSANPISKAIASHNALGAAHDTMQGILVENGMTYSHGPKGRGIGINGKGGIRVIRRERTKGRSIRGLFGVPRATRQNIVRGVQYHEEWLVEAIALSGASSKNCKMLRNKRKRRDRTMRARAGKFERVRSARKELAEIM